VTLSIQLKMVDKLENLENHIETLLKQKNVLQSIEIYTNNRIDFGDLIETYNLLVEEIERLRQQLSQVKTCLPVPEERRCFEEEEEEISSFSSKYEVEHVIRDEHGKLRSVEKDDIDLEKHEGVKQAFKIIYELHKSYFQCNEEDEEEEELLESNRFSLQDQEGFNKLIKDKG